LARYKYAAPTALGKKGATLPRPEMQSAGAGNPAARGRLPKMGGQPSPSGASSDYSTIKHRTIMNKWITVLLACYTLTWSSFAFGGEIQDAARDGDLAKVEALLKNNPNLVKSNDATNPPPLLMAIAHDHKDVAELLLANHANVNAKGPHEFVHRSPTALHLAAYCGFKDEAELLLKYHADINATNDNGETPLYVAAHFSRTNVVKLLLANKAQVNLKNAEGKTPLHVAAEWGSKETVALLIAYHADVNAKDNAGHSPLHIAAQPPTRDDVVKMLLAAGADGSAKEFEIDMTESRRFNAALSAVVSEGMTFSNAVAVLGNNYQMETNIRDSVLTATFPPRKLPGLTNRYILSLDFRNF
jgi:hypothetical protein